MISHFDEPFEVQIIRADEVRRYLISPVYHKMHTEASFSVSLDGKDLGKLKRHTIKRWIWEEGKVEQALADEIGIKIDDHFS
ncbi:hypothetical protein B0I27_102379 [Arcticibacter pallidicorallinus]|uniref:Uncharacterized protein n=1 Tax=Arcticibacter pallidicorallinus TaxID=1259464 RepID=A0A2T0U9L1_9SPHI|nr:hypothetical protein [Arcticibacter pallidicorallinus]PRY54610.1 hypothetical protein B0I27_102379 [Arcticibacter pallidicorallinus]